MRKESHAVVVQIGIGWQTMSLVSHWMHVELFTVDQAAALWAGFDPSKIYISDMMKPSEVVAAKQMIIAGIVGGEINANSTTNALSIIGDYSTSLVSRTDLEIFARRRTLFPAFLFDTLATFESTGGLQEDRPAPRTKVVQGELPLPPTNRGGRPQEHDWNAFIFEIIRRANQPDGLPDTQAELVREMLTWFQSKTGREPAESAVKDRISKIYRYMAEAKNLEG